MYSLSSCTGTLGVVVPEKSGLIAQPVNDKATPAAQQKILNSFPISHPMYVGI